MWVFFDFGLLMPALVDDDLMKRADWNEYSDNGRFDFQVRSRLVEHAKYFQENFMQEGTYGPILHTPDHDYNYRFYTTREAYADGMREAIMAIDYRKFKPASSRYEYGDKYHTVLNSIWADVCELNGPGGFYGPRSADNPKGYEPARRYSAKYGSFPAEGRRIGDTFGNIDFGDDSDRGWFGEDLPDPDDDSLDYVPEGSSRMFAIVDELDRYGVAMEDWPLNLTPDEFEEVMPILKSSFGKKKIKRMRRECKSQFAV